MCRSIGDIAGSVRELLDHIRSKVKIVNQNLCGHERGLYVIVSCKATEASITVSSHPVRRAERMTVKPWTSC